jgi:hypothetical protein
MSRPVTISALIGVVATLLFETNGLAASTVLCGTLKKVGEAEIASVPEPASSGFYLITEDQPFEIRVSSYSMASDIVRRPALYDGYKACVTGEMKPAVISETKNGDFVSGTVEHARILATEIDSTDLSKPPVDVCGVFKANGADFGSSSPWWNWLNSGFTVNLPDGRAFEVTVLDYSWAWGAVTGKYSHKEFPKEYAKEIKDSGSYCAHGYIRGNTIQAIDLSDAIAASPKANAQRQAPEAVSKFGIEDLFPYFF